MAATSAANARELGQLRVDDLRSKCQKRGLPASGRKDELMARLIAADKKAPDKKVPDKTVPDKTAPPRNYRDMARLIEADKAEKAKQKEAESAKLSKTTGSVKKIGHGSTSGSGTRAATPRSPKAGASSSSQRSRSQDRTRSPSRKVMIGTPQDLDLQSPERMPRRRLREKSPDPVRHVRGRHDELGFMGSSPCRGDVGSPVRAARKRIREKSPDPHRYARDWHNELGFVGSPIALRRGQQDSSPNLRAAPTTPGRRLRSKTPECQIVLHESQVPKPPSDPAQALMLLTRRELLEMCMECGVSIQGAKAILIGRLVEAHHAGPEPVPEPLAIADVSEPVLVPKASASTAIQPPSIRRVSIVPPPPSSWSAPPLPSSWTSAPALEVLDEPEVPSEVVHEPEVIVTKERDRSLPTKVASLLAPAFQSRISTSPTPARSLSTAMPAESYVSPPRLLETEKASTSSSNDWWRNVALRWPKIVANLKASTPDKYDAAPCSPLTSQGSLAARSVGSPSILDSLQSPKRDRSTFACSSPTASFQRYLP